MPFTMLSVVVPVYNERETLAEIVRQIRAVDLDALGHASPIPSWVADRAATALGEQRFHERLFRRH